MKVTETEFPGLVVIEPTVYGDDRGYFFESYHEEKFKEFGAQFRSVQDNESKSVYGVVRGLHYQTGEFSQAKRVRVIYGAVWDVALDMRKGSPTYGKCFALELNGENKKQIIIPTGFAHGFSVISEDCIFTYNCSAVYSPAHEGGVLLDDPDLNIDWKIPMEKRIISDRDRNWKTFKETETDFVL